MEKPMNFLRGKAQVLWKTYVLKHLTIGVISYLFLYMRMIYHWKGLEENYNFVVESISIKIQMHNL
jgi:hypothetical protein